MSVVDARTPPECNSLGSVLGFDRLDFFGDVVEGFVPRNSLPLAGALLADAHQRIIEATRVVKLLDRRCTSFRAQGPSIDWVRSVTNNFLDRAVYALDDRSTAAVAHATDCLDALNDPICRESVGNLVRF
jgi:hypothetical protein